MTTSVALKPELTASILFSHTGNYFIFKLIASSELCGDFREMMIAREVEYGDRYGGKSRSELTEIGFEISKSSVPKALLEIKNFCRSHDIEISESRMPALDNDPD